MRQDANADSTRRRRPVAVGAREARADADVGVARHHHVEQRAELGRIVLTVPVDPDRKLVALLRRVAEPGLHGSADPEVERQRDHECSMPACALGGRIL